MKKTLVMVALTALAVAAFGANPPAIQWQRTFAPMGVGRGAWVEVAHDGGYVAAGWTDGLDSYGQVRMRCYLVKTDSLGNLEWERTFLGDEAHCVRPTSDGGYILSGRGTDDAPPGRATDLDQSYVVKTDASGLLEWQRFYVHDKRERGYGFGITETFDGGYAHVAINPTSRDSGLVVFKLDSSGAVEWQRAYAPFENRWRESVTIEQAPDSGYIIGFIELVKLSPAGVLQWSVQHEYVAQANSAWPTHDGGYVATGPGYFSSVLPQCTANVYLIKTDGAGNLQWRRTWGGHGGDEGYSVRQTPDLGYVIAAQFRPQQGPDYGCVIRTDSLGNTLWTVPLSSSPSWSCVYGICVAPDGGYVVVGRAPSPEDGLSLWKLAPDGQ